jgi:hypothetical protein
MKAEVSHVDEIAAYPNEDGTYQVIVNISGTDNNGIQQQGTIKIPKAHLNFNMTVTPFVDTEYEIILRG